MGVHLGNSYYNEGSGRYRVQVTPVKRGKGKRVNVTDEPQYLTPAERHAAMTWPQRLKRVFNIDIKTCRECGGAVKVSACIKEPVVIEKILTLLDETASTTETPACPRAGHPRRFACSTDQQEA